MRADRLLSLILLLQAHGKMTAKDLADKLEVSERTILRDMDALSASGVPVFAERGSGGGWQLTEGFRTSLTGMKKEEAQSLLLLGTPSALNDLGLQQVYEAARLKLQAALPAIYRKDMELVRERIHIDGAGWDRARESFPHLLRIQEAVWSETRLRIFYRGQEETVERTIEPLGLVAKSGSWYTVAAVDGAIRTYRVSRIDAVFETGETFRRPEPFDLAAYWEQSTAQFQANLPRYTARVRMSEKALRSMSQRRFVAVERTSPADDAGWVVADVRFDAFAAACEMLLGYGPQAEALEPEELRRELRAQAEAIAAMYA